MIIGLLVVFFLLLFLGVPIAFSLGLSAISAILFFGGGNIITVGQRVFEGMNTFALLAVPLFTFSGFIMGRGGVAKRIIDFSYSLVGRFTGGLAQVNILTSMIFAGMSGAAVADTAGVGGMMMPEMVKKGYSKKFTVAVTAISSTIGIIIPPSIPMVVISGIVGLSTGKLFLGGIIPGILLGVAQMVVSYFVAKKQGIPREENPPGLREILKSSVRSLPALLMPVVIVGSIISGIVSPTEAGIIAVIYGLLVGGLIYRDLKWKDIKESLYETAKTSGKIFIIIGTAKLFTIMLTSGGFDKWLTNVMFGFTTNSTMILLMILLLFFIVTMFMETNATLTLFMPIIFSIAMTAKIDPILLCVLITITVGVGLVTPPVGLCLYVASDLMKIKSGSVVKDIIPFLIVTFAVMGLIIMFPDIVLWPASWI